MILRLRAAPAALLLVCCECTTRPEERPPTLTRLDPPADAGAMGPNLAAVAGGVLLTWLEPDGSGHALRFSRLVSEDERRGWVAPRTIATGETFFANWADFPSMTRSPDGALVAHWLARSGGGPYAYDVRLSRSLDEGGSWTGLGPPHRDGTQTEHGFVSMIPDAGGVRVFWLDGREMGQAAKGAASGHEVGGEGGSMTLRTALVGAEVGEEQLLDDRVCECCQTSAAVTRDGPLVVYRDRSASEVRDIWAVRKTAQGWSRPYPVRRDGWEVPGCPVNGPSVAADGSDVAVAWFTAADNRPRVQVAFSHDSGARFAPPVEIDVAEPLGRVGLVMDGAGGALAVWLASARGDSAEIRLRRVSAGGIPGEPLVLSSTAPTRASGFPRIARLGGSLVVAWTGEGQPSRLCAALVPLSAVPSASATEGRPARHSGERGAARAWDREIGSGAPSYAASGLDGGRVTLSDLRGQPVMVNFWATWCPPCREETPALIALHDRHAGEGLRVVGVSLDDAASVDLVRRLVAKEGVPYTMLHDPEDRASGLFGLPALPGTFLFDRDGALVWKRLGVVRADDPDLAAALAAALRSERD